MWYLILGYVFLVWIAAAFFVIGQLEKHRFNGMVKNGTSEYIAAILFVVIMPVVVLISLPVLLLKWHF